MQLSHLWVLALLALLIPLIIWRRDRRYQLRRATLMVFQGKGQIKGRSFWKKNLPYFLLMPALALLIIAAADPFAGERKIYKKLIIHNYILMNDGSGSMVSFGEEKGVGRSLQALMSANEEFLNSLEKLEKLAEQKDLVGLIAFSHDAYVVSYPTADYRVIKKKLELIHWNAVPLGGGTELANALWTGIQVVMAKTDHKDDLAAFEKYCSGSGSNLNLPASLKTQAQGFADEIIGTSFIIFTDGNVYMTGSLARLSTGKILDLCRLLKIRVHLISVEWLGADLQTAIAKTGGSVAIVKKASDAYKLKEIYKQIAERHAREYLIEDRLEKRSYYLWFAVPGTCLLFIWLFVRNTVSRSLTTV